MQLEQVAHYNNLSSKLRKELEEKLKSFGKTVRYKFDISKPNPDPSKYNGDIVWPNKYTLDPAVWDIIDPYEENGKSKSKKIALVDGVDDKGIPNRFRKIRIEATRRGILVLNIEDNQEDYYTAMAIELHPKLSNGRFAEKNGHHVVSRVDEIAEAATQRKNRTARIKALNAAEEMSTKQVVDFADAMSWDSGEPESLLRNKIEQLAEDSPDFFNDLVAGKSIEYQSLIKQSLDKGIIAFDPAGYRFTWVSTTQTITILSPVEGKGHVELFSEWLQTGGEKADAIYKKLMELSKAPVKS